MRNNRSIERGRFGRDIFGDLLTYLVLLKIDSVLLLFVVRVLPDFSRGKGISHIFTILKSEIHSTLYKLFVY